MPWGQVLGGCTRDLASPQSIYKKKYGIFVSCYFNFFFWSWYVILIKYATNKFLWKKGEIIYMTCTHKVWFSVFFFISVYFKKKLISKFQISTNSLYIKKGFNLNYFPMVYLAKNPWLPYQFLGYLVEHCVFSFWKKKRSLEA